MVKNIPLKQNRRHLRYTQYRLQFTAASVYYRQPRGNENIVFFKKRIVTLDPSAHLHWLFMSSAWIKRGDLREEPILPGADFKHRPPGTGLRFESRIHPQEYNRPSLFYRPAAFSHIIDAGRRYVHFSGGVRRHCNSPIKTAVFNPPLTDNPAMYAVIVSRGRCQVADRFRT